MVYTKAYQLQPHFLRPEYRHSPIAQSQHTTVLHKPQYLLSLNLRASYHRDSAAICLATVSTTIFHRVTCRCRPSSALTGRLNLTPPNIVTLAMAVQVAQRRVSSIKLSKSPSVFTARTPSFKSMVRITGSSRYLYSWPDAAVSSRPSLPPVPSVVWYHQHVTHREKIISSLGTACRNRSPCHQNCYIQMRSAVNMPASYSHQPIRNAYSPVPWAPPMRPSGL